MAGTQEGTWYVTRSLFLGALPDLPTAVKVDDAAQAVEVIRSGGVAVLPAGAWDTADEVLWLLDLSRGWREHVLHWARTGKVNRPVRADEHPAEPPPRQPTVASGEGPWPDPADGEKAGPRDELVAELAALEQEDAFRHAAVLRLGGIAAGLGMHPDDGLRRALDETAADDEAFHQMLLERLGAPEPSTEHHPEDQRD